MAFDIYFYSFRLPGGGQLSNDPAQMQLLSVVVVVATINAVNFVDGLDGLAAGVIGIGAVAFFLFSYTLADANDETLAITAALLCAALGGRRVHGLPAAQLLPGPALHGRLRIDAHRPGPGRLGAQPERAVRHRRHDRGGRRVHASLLPTLLPIILPIAILIVPFADLVLAVIRRTRAGRSPFAPDKQHLHHRLLEIGHSHRRAVLIMWLWAGLIAFGGVLASLYAGPFTTYLPRRLGAGHGRPHLRRAPDAEADLAPLSGPVRRPAGLGMVDHRFPRQPDFVLVFTSVSRALGDSS